MNEQRLDRITYYDRVYGGFYGKCIGSYLGMPLELRPYSFIKSKHGEISDYVKIYNKGLVNDDEMYEIVGLMALEVYGSDLTSKDLANAWLAELYTNMFTAEKTAFKNLKRGIYPPESGRRNNMYYDFIGGQMKGEIWGWIVPGHPEIAEKYGRMDAEIAHGGEGILGEIFISRIISAAFFEKNPKKLIEIALKTISRDSLYFEFVNKAIELQDKNADWRHAREKMITYWKKTKNTLIKESTNSKRRIMLSTPLAHKIHVLPNIGLIILALLYGEGDFSKSICIAAMAGYDTDCNCGNVGAIIGTSIGESEIPKKWKLPINDVFKTKLRSFREAKISSLARRICDVGREIINDKK
jgi:ADP-ribosylglycohydrolase